MAIKKNFKIISDDKTEIINSQEIIEVSDEDINKISENLSTFFSSVKTLLREGAVFVDDSEVQVQNEEVAKEEDFLEDPSIYGKKNAILSLALGSLPKEQNEAFAKQIEGIKMTEDFEFSLIMKQESKLKEGIEKAISKELKAYSLALPDIMKERAEKLKLLFDARPDIKLYLENKGKS
jgi:hypothetical protein